MAERERDRNRESEQESERHAPLNVREQSAPEPERPRRPAEEAGEAPHQVEDPPQAEGDREGD